MLQLNNRTPFKCGLGLFPNPDGVDCAYGVVKATFHFDSSGVVLAKEQLAPVMADEFWGDPQLSSLKQAAEVGLARPSTEILLLGHAYGPEREVRSADVRLTVGPVGKTVRVFGDRVWERGLFGLRASSPNPFQKVALKYELAFGGTDARPKDPAKPDYEPRNPVGRGLMGEKSQAASKGAPLPNLEDPLRLIKSPKDRPAPAGFGPICAHWEPRKKYAGTYDAAWLKKRAPYLPVDFDPKFLQTAPRDLVAPVFFKGGEPVEIDGASPGPPLRFDLPRCSLSIVFHFDGQPRAQKPNLEIVCFEPDEKRISMVWRATQVVDKKPHQLRELEVRCAEFPLAAAKR